MTLHHKAKKFKREFCGGWTRREGRPRAGKLSVSLGAHLWLIFTVPPKSRTSARDRVLAQWRGVDLSSEETSRALRARRAAEVLPALMKDLKLDSRRAEAEVTKVWNELIDPNVTAHAQPAGIRNGTLFVVVDNSVWLSEIVRYRRKEILERLQNSFGKTVIQKISFRVG